MAPVLEYVKELWQLFQPTAGSEFDALDRQVLRLAIERRYQSVTGDVPGPSQEFERYVRGIVDNQHFGDASARLWQDFLMRRADPADNEVFARSRLTPSAGGHDHLSVMSRAALLLRLASGSVSGLMGNAGIAGADTEFWWSELGSARGMWTGTSPPNPLTDMWADVRDALDEVEVFQRQNLPGAQTSFRVSAEIASTFPVLGAAERIGLWAVHKR